MTGEQRRLAAIVSADVAGYSRLMDQDKSGTLVALRADDCLVRPGVGRSPENRACCFLGPASVTAVVDLDTGSRP